MNQKQIKSTRLWRPERETLVENGKCLVESQKQPHRKYLHVVQQHDVTVCLSTRPPHYEKTYSLFHECASKPRSLSSRI